MCTIICSRAYQVTPGRASGCIALYMWWQFTQALNCYANVSIRPRTGRTLKVNGASWMCIAVENCSNCVKQMQHYISNSNTRICQMLIDFRLRCAELDGDFTHAVLSKFVHSSAYMFDLKESSVIRATRDCISLVYRTFIFIEFQFSPAPVWLFGIRRRTERQR